MKSIGILTLLGAGNGCFSTNYFHILSVSLISIGCFYESQIDFLLKHLLYDLSIRKEK